LANNENLKPFQSTEEARERGRKGGIASGIARRERKTLREELLLLLQKNESQERISLALLQKALDGDIKAYEVIRDTIGEKPVEKTQNEVNVSYETMLKEVEDENEY
jgi:hypothetical protein